MGQVLSSPGRARGRPCRRTGLSGVPRAVV